MKCEHEKEYRKYINYILSTRRNHELTVSHFSAII